MASSSTTDVSVIRPNPVFATTCWSAVLAAGNGETANSREALSYLCKVYWFPLYAFARRRGWGPDDAQDVTQEFFARLLEGNWLSQADRQRGRFRSFLLTSMKNFLANEWHKARAQKRGGAQSIISLDEDLAEHRYRTELSEQATPESIFERQWALSLLNDVLTKLENEYRSDGKVAWMEAMRPGLIMDRAGIDYGEIGAKLGMTESAARVAVHRLRGRYRRLIKEEVARTVASQSEVEEEMRHLIEVLAGK